MNYFHFSQEPQINRQIIWSRSHRQAVVFFPFGQRVNFTECAILKFSSRFQSKTGNFEVDFKCM